MPEGPEIRLAADKLERVLVDRPLLSVQITMPGRQHVAERLTGCAVTAIETRGKAMLTRFDDGTVMYSHNQLYGRWYTSKLPRLPKTGRSLRVAFDTATHTARLYSATDIDFMQESEVEQHPFLRSIGPDLLSTDLTQQIIVDRLDAKQFRRRSLGALYLDQHFIAGIGNYLRSEILWEAKLAPHQRPMHLSDTQRHQLAQATLRIGRRAYLQRGVTVPKKLAADLKAQGLSYRQYRHYVFSRENQACYHCGEGIRRIAVSSRQFYFCPSCQP